MQSYTKMRSRKFPDVIMKVIPGHFVTPNSHINYYIDMTTMKTRQSEAKAAARAMASTYAATTIVDTIVCMDGMEVIGAYLADELTPSTSFCFWHPRPRARRSFAQARVLTITAEPL